MAKTPWWAKVPTPTGPDPVMRALDPRMRQLRAVYADTHLRDEPQVAGAFMNANVPMSLAMRADAEYQQVKAQKKNDMLTQNGFSNALGPQEQAALLARQQEQQQHSFWDDPFGGAIDVAKGAVTGLFHGLNALFSPLSVPAAVYNANKSTSGSGVDNYLRQQSDAAINSAFFGLPVASIVKGVPQLISGDLSPDQQADMRKQGYDPTSFASRYAWYYDGMEPGQKAVSDDDVRYFSQEYDPDKVKTVREILTSNFLNDQKIEALSPAAQKMVQGLQGDITVEGVKDQELFNRMASSSTLNPGSAWADALGLERGTTPANIAAAAGDIVTYWFADPFAGAAKAVNVGRAALYGFDAGRIASMDEKLMRLAEPGNIASKPAAGASRAFSNLMDTVDNVYVLQASNDAAKMNQAAKLTNDFMLRNPGMASHFDALMAMRSGRVEGMRLREHGELVQGLNKNRKVNPFVFAERDADKLGTPVWRFRDDQGNLLSQAEQNEAKANVVSKLSEFIYAEAVNTGRPLHRGIALLPGEVAINRRIRSALAPMRDALIGANKSVYKAFDTRSGIVKFDGSFDRADEMLVGDGAGQWIAQNYNRKFARNWEMAASRFDKAFSGRTLSFDTPDGLETYRRFVTQFMPRRIAYILTNKWAMANPAERMAQWRQTAEAIEHAAGFRQTPMARELTDYLTKGVAPRRNELDRAGPLEAYSGMRHENSIIADGQEIAAGIHGYQMSNGIVLPSMREIRQLQQKVGVLSGVAGIFNSNPVRQITALWKIGKVGNPANMMRQVSELVALHSLEQGFGAAIEGAKMRRFVSHETSTARMGDNEAARVANKFADVATHEELNVLNQYARSGDWNAYSEAFRRMAELHGFGPQASWILGHLASGVRFEDLTASKLGLALAAPVDFARAVRLRFHNLTGVTQPVDSPWQRYLDEEIATSFTRSALNDLGAAKEQYAMLGGENVMDDILKAADVGFPARPARIPNTRDWLGANGDRGAQMWHKETASRASDGLGNLVQRAVAMEARAVDGAAVTPAELLNEEALQAALRQDALHVRLNESLNRATHQGTKDFLRRQIAKRELEVAAASRIFPSEVKTAEDVARYLIGQHELGNNLRANAMRLRYTAEGKLITGDEEMADAVQRLAQVMVRDHQYHLGARFKEGKPEWDEGFHDLLDKVAAGKGYTVRDFSDIPDILRPKEISTPLYVPSVGKMNKKTLINQAGKLYSFTVARPLDRLAATPSFLANRNVAYRKLEPVFDELKGRGFSEEQAAALLESTASRYAVNATFRYTDEAIEHSVFSELTDNFLMFQRASEDFIRRFMRVTSANPQILSRAYLLTEAGQHSGMIYPQTSTDDEGNPETHLVMTFPGSGVMAKAIQETGQALGWGDSDLILKPLYSSMSSQLRFINPSLNNPLGFSTSPLIGMNFRIARSLFPESEKTITGILSNLEGGGEPFFAEQNILQSLMPSPLARLVPALTPEDADSQLASATRNAMIYYGAAGLLPGPMATADERQKAHDAIREMAINQLVWRAAVGLFSPMAPQYNEPEGLGLPGANVVDQARGISSLRGEWFELLRQSTEKYGSAQGFAEANVEWLRRHPDGKSIINPTVFAVGTTKAAGQGGEAGSVNSGPGVTQWMLNNKQWVKDHSAVAYYLLPDIHEPQFSAAGMRSQLANGFREHKSTEDFMNDVLYQIGVKEFYDRLDFRGKQLASGTPKDKAYGQFDEWKKGWETANPAVAAEMAKRQDPNYVHGTLAPALAQLVQSGKAPAGVPMDLAKQVYALYRDYREQYNKVQSGFAGQAAQRKINAAYREKGDQMFTGTPVQDLWKAMKVYE